MWIQTKNDEKSSTLEVQDTGREVLNSPILVSFSRRILRYDYIKAHTMTATPLNSCKLTQSKCSILKKETNQTQHVDGNLTWETGAINQLSATKQNPSLSISRKEKGSASRVWSTQCFPNIFPHKLLLAPKNSHESSHPCSLKCPDDR